MAFQWRVITPLTPLTCGAACGGACSTDSSRAAQHTTGNTSRHASTGARCWMYGWVGGRDPLLVRVAPPHSSLLTIFILTLFVLTLCFLSHICCSLFLSPAACSDDRLMWSHVVFSLLRTLITPHPTSLGFLTTPSPPTDKGEASSSLSSEASSAAHGQGTPILRMCNEVLAMTQLDRRSSTRRLLSPLIKIYARIAHDYYDRVSRQALLPLRGGPGQALVPLGGG